MRSSFNPHSRWDRHIPQTGQETINTDELDERIEVLALFKNGAIYPRSFLWKNKKYSVEKITYNWQERSGKERISYFSVSTGADLYQISFNNTSYAWRMNKIIK